MPHNEVDEAFGGGAAGTRLLAPISNVDSKEKILWDSGGKQTATLRIS